LGCSPGGPAARAQSERYSGGDDHPLRAPFTSDQTPRPAELKEEIRGQGGRKTVGETGHLPVLH